MQLIFQNYFVGNYQFSCNEKNFVNIYMVKVELFAKNSQNPMILWGILRNWLSYYYTQKTKESTAFLGQVINQTKIYDSKNADD